MLLAGTPDAVTVILPEYAVADAASVVASAETVTVTGAPGNTTPVAGVTDSHADPAATVKGTGPPVVVSVKDCDAGWVGGEENDNDVTLITSVGKAFETFSVTPILRGLATPVAVTWMVPWYVPTAKEVGFTRTERVAGMFPDVGVAVSHWTLVPVIVKV